MAERGSAAQAYVCESSGTALLDLEPDGARCGNRTHWHRRLPGGGFAAARPVAGPPTYRELPTSPSEGGRADGPLP
jgi:hypothetical protein